MVPLQQFTVTASP